MSVASQSYERVKRSFEAFGAGEGLKAKVFRGGAWLGAGSFLEQALRFGRNMLLTRLLAPEAFGTMAIVMSATAVFASISEVGAKEALIHNPRGREEEYVGAAWWLSFGRSSFIYASLFLLAPWVSRFYTNPDLTALMRVAAIGLVFEGATSAKAYVAMKEMKFRKWALIQHGGAIAGVLLTVVLSFWIRDVWALALGFLAENVGRFLLSYMLCPYIPPFGWNKEAARQLLNYSRGVFGLAILNLIFIRTDIFVLAKLYSPAELGIYSMAVYLVQTPASFIIKLMSQTLMPTFSHIQHDVPRINRILSRVKALVFLVGMPLLVFLFFCGRSLLTLVYGHRYSAGSTALIVASAVALLNIANNQITTVFFAKGLPQLHRACVAVMAVIMPILIYPFAKWFGLAGGQLAALVAIVFGYLVQIWLVRNVTHPNFSNYFKSFLISVAISLSVVVTCLAARSFDSAARPLLNVLFGVMGCLVAYGLACAIRFRAGRELGESMLGF